MPKKLSLSTDSTVVFRNSQGIEAQGTLMRLNRNSVVFEVYNPYSIVQLSEVLSSLRIRRGERDIYVGRAVVTNLISTGLMLVVSASLVDPWSDLAGLTPGPQLRDEVQGFIQDWSGLVQQLRPAFKDSVANMRNFYEELSRWLERGETVAGINQPETPQDLNEEFVTDVEAVVRGQLDDLYGVFEDESKQVPRSLVVAHKAYAQRELHPLVMCSPFLYRTFTKPLGYAGDYEMVNMMLRNPREGRNTFAKVVNSTALGSDAVQGHRNRIDILSDLLVRESRRVSEQGRTFRVANLGCGPAIEVQRFIEGSWLSDRADLELLDFNDETLNYTEAHVNELIRKLRRRTVVKFCKRSVSELLQRAAELKIPDEPAYDLVYCAGLFDYFGSPTCGFLLHLLYAWAYPGGTVFVTNVMPGHSRENMMKYLQEWNLHSRSEQDLLELAPDLGVQRAFCDATGSNAFLEIRKPEDNADAVRPA